MRVLLTGGAGFIGSHTALLMLEKGYDVIIFDSFVNSSIKSIQAIKSYLDANSISYKLKTIIGDIRDSNCLDNVFKDSIKEENPIQAVIHFAGLKSVSESISNPLEYWDVNVCGTNNILNIMNSNECYSIVFSSSATVYGLSDSIPITEEVKVSPFNTYGVTKVAIENMLKDLYLSKSNLWKISSLRYFNPVGAHFSGLIGEDPKGEPNNLFPYITQVAIGKRGLLKVFGDDWDTNDGSGVRDYIHVMDLAEGHLACMKYLLPQKTCYENINLGSGIGYSVYEIINEFHKSTGREIPYKVVERRSGDIPISVADISKARSLLRWIPKKTLKQMCIDGMNWQSKHPNGYV